jgi:hypothetical protein
MCGESIASFIAQASVEVGEVFIFLSFNIISRYLAGPGRFLAGQLWALWKDGW